MTKRKVPPHFLYRLAVEPVQTVQMRQKVTIGRVETHFVAALAGKRRCQQRWDWESWGRGRKEEGLAVVGGTAATANPLLFRH